MKKIIAILLLFILSVPLINAQISIAELNLQGKKTQIPNNIETGENIFRQRKVECNELNRIDSNRAKFFFEKAKLKHKEYEKYKDFRIKSKVIRDMSKEVQADLDSAEYFYNAGLAIDSANYDGLYGIVRFYQSTMELEKTYDCLKKGKLYYSAEKDIRIPANNNDAILKYLKKIAKFYPDDKDVHLHLGIYYYKKKKLDESFAELQKGLDLMKPDEKEDFVYNSVIEMLKTKYSGELKEMTKEEKLIFVDKWWKLSDPFYLTGNNERLLEHYIRVAYSNLFYSVPNYGLTGWKTDRGQAYIRFGEPDREMRIFFEEDSALMCLWEYDRMPGFVFTGTGNYLKFTITDEFEALWGSSYLARTAGFTKFSLPSFSSGLTPVNSLKDYNAIILQRIQSYKPVLYGKKINLDFKTFIFKKLTETNEAKVDVYAAYTIPTRDTTNLNEVKDFTHEIGVFFFDQNFNPIIQVRDTLSESQINMNYPSHIKEMVNCVGFGITPRQISFAFDLRRMIDSNYFTYRKTIDLSPGDSRELRLSDLVFTNSIELEKELPFGIKRGEISFYPKLSNKFNNGEQFYIYYEVYNLKMNDKKEGEYEQVITIKPKGKDDTILKKIVKGITTIFTGDEGKVSLTANYRTKEENTQVYMQLDLTGYKPGNYELSIRINDKVSGNSHEKKTDLEIL